MNKGNFTAKDNFPVSTFTYDFLQKMAQLTGNLALLGGQNYILSGCTEVDTTVSEGLIVINGEILPFEAGMKKAKITIQETMDTEHFDGIDYPESYIHRVAKFADNGEYNWSDFVQIQTISEIAYLVNKVIEEPVGVIKIWAGSETTVPTNYMICNGVELNKSEYEKLFTIIGYTYGGSSSVFRLPNLKRRVPVGADLDDTSEYKLNQLGHTGGEEKHQVTISEMPSHSHDILGSESDNGDPGSLFTQSPSQQIDPGVTQTSGGNQPHNNMQPYIVIHYIIKVK